MDIKALSALAESAIGGDQNALTSLYEQTVNPFYFYAFKAIGNQEDAQDALQNSYIHMISNIGTLKNPDAFLGWFKRILYNECCDIRKKNGKYILSSDNDELTDKQSIEENADFLPEELLENNEMQETVLACFDDLPDSQKQITLLFYYDQMKVREIAEIVGTTENSVNVQLYNARRKLKTSLQKFKDKGMLCAMPLPVLTRFFVQNAEKNQIPPVINAQIAASIAAETKSAPFNAFAETLAKASKIGAKLSFKLLTILIAGTIAFTGTVVGLIYRNKKPGANSAEISASSKSVSSIVSSAVEVSSADISSAEAVSPEIISSAPPVVSKAAAAVPSKTTSSAKDNVKPVTTTTAAAPTQQEVTAEFEKLIAMINTEREKAGLNKVIANWQPLSQAANKRAIEMQAHYANLTPISVADAYAGLAIGLLRASHHSGRNNLRPDGRNANTILNDFGIGKIDLQAYADNGLDDAIERGYITADSNMYTYEEYIYTAESLLNADEHMKNDKNYLETFEKKSYTYLDQSLVYASIGYNPNQTTAAYENVNWVGGPYVVMSFLYFSHTDTSNGAIVWPPYPTE